MANGEMREGGVAAPERGPTGSEKEKSPENEAAPQGAEVRVGPKDKAPAPRESLVGKGLQAQAAPAQAKDKYRMQVERGLKNNLWEVYFALDEATRAKFKAAGEELAGKIRAEVEKKHVKPNKIVSLIMTWLRMIPHVNRWFLEQEAKIKTDIILTLVEERKKEEGLA